MLPRVSGVGASGGIVALKMIAAPADPTNDLPASLAPCFQEYQLSALDAEADRALVIERVLAYGNRAEVRWLLGRYGQPTVVAWIERSGARRLPRRRYVVWSVILCDGKVPPAGASGAVAWPH